MTFDEALNELEPRTIWSSEMRDLLEQLRQEYAPMVEMTKEQKTELLIMKNNEEHIVDIVGDTNVMYSIDTEFNIVTAFLDKFWEPLTEKQLVHAWLHPETIKIVDE